MQIPRKEGKNSFKLLMFKILIITQLLMLIATSLHTRTPLIWIWAISSFIPPAIICVLTDKKRFVIPSLLLLYISQHAIFVFSRSPWGYNSGSDPINDLHVANVISEKSNFMLGQVGYAGRPSYSYYPFLHLFSVFLNKISGLPLSFIAVYVVPIFNASIVCVMLYFLAHELFGLNAVERNVATLFFGLSYSFTTYHSGYTREVFAFPLVMLSVWMVNRLLRRSNRAYAITLFVFFTAIIFSHHISSYVLFVILMVIVLSTCIFRQRNVLTRLLLLYTVIVLTYISYVTITIFIQHILSTYRSFQSVSYPSAPHIMKYYETWRAYLAMIHYLIISVLALAGWLKLFLHTRKEKKWDSFLILTFFAFAFLLCALLRLSVPEYTEKWNWTFYLAFRGITWAFIGLSAIAALGFTHVIKIKNHVNLKSCLLLIAIIFVLAAGKFSQYPLYIDSTKPVHVNYSRYVSTLWLKDYTLHGSNFLVAPFGSESFYPSLEMAPYAYLKPYFLDDAPYAKFCGYIPLIGGFFDQYENATDVQIIYCNGETLLGYKS